MVKTSLQDDILKLLQDARYGLSISKMAQKLEASRTTITKYLKILEDEGKAFVQDIGQYKLWYQKEKYLQNKTRREALSTFYEPFYLSLLQNIPKFIKNPENLKELGKVMAKDLNFSDMTDIMVSQQFKQTSLLNLTKLPNVIPPLQFMAQKIMTIMNSILTTFDNYHWAAPVILEEQNILILRMENSEYLSLPAHFHIFSGIMEEEMSKYINVRVQIHQIHPQNNIVDIKFQF
jgi:biotin operon repressor